MTCHACGAQLSAGAKFCHKCGAAVATTGATGWRAGFPWALAGAALGALVTVVAMRATSGPARSDQAVAPFANGAASGGGVRPPDISQMSPEERANRLFNRVMTLADASSTNQLEFYQYNFNATWISRDVRWNNGGWPADVICPTLKLPICPFGLLNCGVFKKLNASARNCTRLL